MAYPESVRSYVQLWHEIPQGERRIKCTYYTPRGCQHSQYTSTVLGDVGAPCRSVRVGSDASSRSRTSLQSRMLVTSCTEGSISVSIGRRAMGRSCRTCATAVGRRYLVLPRVLSSYHTEFSDRSRIPRTCDRHQLVEIGLEVLGQGDPRELRSGNPWRSFCRSFLSSILIRDWHNTAIHGR